jgi:hypothetical protein
MLGGEDFDTESLIGKERRLLKTERLEGGRIIKHFTDGTSEVTDDIGESKSKERYDEATGYVYRSFMTGPNAGHAQLVLGEDGTPLKLTPSQANARGIAYGKAEGQAEGEYANRGLTAATTATVKGAETTAVKGAEHRAKARETLGKFAPVTQELRKSIQKLSTHPGLENITGEKGGRIPDDPKWRARWAALRAGTPEMEALALHDQLQGGTFLEGILPIIGAGAGQITEVEGAALKAAAGRLARSQSTDAYKRSLVDFNDLLDRIEARLEADSKEPTGTQSAPAAGGSMGDYEITVSP